MNEEKLESEAERMTQLLKGKTVKLCARHEPGELAIIFKDGTRLFINSKSKLDFSITGDDS
ncbi:MAG: hypothetical protein KJ725_06320 [Gammaproteobacteria bacterium]|nr:hypothetical protein [Gammaproteobacteria bacterium]